MYVMYFFSFMGIYSHLVLLIFTNAVGDEKVLEYSSVQFLAFLQSLSADDEAHFSPPCRQQLSSMYSIQFPLLVRRQREVRLITEYILDICKFQDSLGIFAFYYIHLFMYFVTSFYWLLLK
jgi:hypothetical protein